MTDRHVPKGRCENKYLIYLGTDTMRIAYMMHFRLNGYPLKFGSNKIIHSLGTIFPKKFFLCQKYERGCILNF